MSIRFHCEQCGKSLTAADRMAGRKARCTGCDAPIVVPFDSAAFVAAAGDALPEEVIEVFDDPEPMVVAAPAPAASTPAAPPKKRKPHVDSGPMFPPKSQEFDHDLIDMTAMVDIVFFLLIFFLVTSMQAIIAVLPLPKPEQAASDDAKPQSVAQVQNDPNAVIVKIEEDDTILVDDEEVYGDDALRLTLKQLRDERTEPAVLVVGNYHGSTGAAVRVLDACASAKLANVRFLVQGEED